MCFKKAHTTLVKAVASKLQGLCPIRKCSEDGVVSGGDLRNASYCRLCGSVAPSYAAAFKHSAGFGCRILLPENSVGCPLCAKAEFTEFHQIAQHLLTQHGHFVATIPFEYVPEMLTTHERKEKSKAKTFTLLWMIKCTIQLYAGHRQSEKLFLPHMSPTAIARKGPTVCKVLTLCPWTVCVCIFGHEHRFETTRNGACKGCRNYHHFVSRGRGKRNCVRQTYQGVLSM